MSEPGDLPPVPEEFPAEWRTKDGTKITIEKDAFYELWPELKQDSGGGGETSRVELPKECVVCGGYWDREEHYERTGELRGLRPYKKRGTPEKDPYICGECCVVLFKKLTAQAETPLYTMWYPIDEYNSGGGDER